MKELTGKELAETKRAELKREITQHKGRPKLVALFAGDDPSAESYIRSKKKIADSIGIEFEVNKFPQDVSTEEFINELKELGAREENDGIIIEDPLPDQINKYKASTNLSPRKDVDCITAENLGRLVKGKPRFIPGTVLGVKWLLMEYGINPEGKNVVIIGRSEIVGLPLANLLLQKTDGANATVTVCHSRTKKLENYTRGADILVSAVGRANLIEKNMIKDGAIIVDIGINFVDGNMVGDVDYEGIKKKADMATPVPGGVGPLTATGLFYNVFKAFQTGR